MNRRTWLGLSLGGAASLHLMGRTHAQETKVPWDLKKNRTTHLQRLKAYAEAGRFPRNTIADGKVTPVFFDLANQVPCAVAHLMIEDGRKEAVLKIAKENNTVKIGSLSEGPVVEWILKSGLIQEECALIQPGYGFRDRERAEQAPVAMIRMHLENVHEFLTSTCQTEHGLERAAKRLGAGR